MNPNELTPEQLSKLSFELTTESNSNVISDELLDFKLWVENKPSRTDMFEKLLLSMLRNKHHNTMRFLEVGCGPRAILSLRLRSLGYDIDAMDPRMSDCLYLSNDGFCREELTMDTDISKYDCIVALEPCDAVEIIIRLCARYNKAYVVVPCGVAHRRLDGNESKNVESWWGYLYTLDSRIKLTPMIVRGCLMPVMAAGL